MKCGPKQTSWYRNLDEVCIVKRYKETETPQKRTEGRN